MDPVSYRSAERAGIRDLNSIRQSLLHTPVTFTEAGFPTRIDCHDDLRLYIDVMHENRFEAMMAELDGLHDDELDEFVDGLVRYCRFHLSMFGRRDIVLPLSGMIMQYAAAKKLQAIPERGSVLEIGPGSGLISFFLKEDEAIRQYHQVETTESFYLLQTHINRYLYGHEFLDHAQVTLGAPKAGGIGLKELIAIRPDILLDEKYEVEASVDYEATPRAEHFPWWRLDRVIENRYDVVMAHANLTEFTYEAMRYYATLFAKVLKPTGVLFIQCFGGGNSTIPTVIRDLTDARLMPFMLGKDFDIPGRSAGEATRRKAMPVYNGLFLPLTHPLLSTVAGHAGGLPLVHFADPMTRAMFGFDRPPGAMRQRDDVVDLVRARLHAH